MTVGLVINITCAALIFQRTRMRGSRYYILFQMFRFMALFSTSASFSKLSAEIHYHLINEQLRKIAVESQSPY